MHFFQSIRFRIIIACIIFATIVNVTYGLLTLEGLKINDDELFNWHIAQDASALLSQYKARGTLNINDTSKAQVIVSDEKTVIKRILPFFKGKIVLDPNKQYASFSELGFDSSKVETEQGFLIYELNVDNISLHVLKAIVSSENNQFLYYFVDVSEFSKHDNHSAGKVSTLFIINFLITTLLAFFIGFKLTNRVVSPLTNLAHSLDLIEHGKYKIKDNTYYNDEIGSLAKTISDFVVRTNDFIDREKAFTRDASHELRTPVANISAALELASTVSNDENIEKYLSRATRANKDMMHLIESFLLLGKEDDSRIQNTTFSLHELVNKSFDKSAYLKRDNTIECINSINCDIMINAPMHYLSIVLDNIIRNALQHTMSGSITVTGDAKELVITDTGEGFCTDNSDEKRSVTVLEKSGIGLSIVERICAKQNWKVSIEKGEHVGTIFYLSLN